MKCLNPHKKAPFTQRKQDKKCLKTALIDPNHPILIKKPRTGNLVARNQVSSRTLGRIRDSSGRKTREIRFPGFFRGFFKSTWRHASGFLRSCRILKATSAGLRGVFYKDKLLRQHGFKKSEKSVSGDLQGRFFSQMVL